MGSARCCLSIAHGEAVLVHGEAVSSFLFSSLLLASDRVLCLFGVVFREPAGFL